MEAQTVSFSVDVEGKSWTAIPTQVWYQKLLANGSQADGIIEAIIDSPRFAKSLLAATVNSSTSLHDLRVEITDRLDHIESDSNVAELMRIACLDWDWFCEYATEVCTTHLFSRRLTHKTDGHNPALNQCVGAMVFWTCRDDLGEGDQSPRTYIL